MMCPPRWVPEGAPANDRLNQALIAGDVDMAVEHAEGPMG